jgi:hypothetical protein
MKTGRWVTQNHQKDSEKHQTKHLPDAGHHKTVKLARGATPAVIAKAINECCCSGKQNLHST